MQTEEGNCCLRWAQGVSHLTSLRGTAYKLQSEPELHDVTLACEDSQTMGAHKVFLAAVSPVFKYLLSKYPHPHTLIYVRAVHDSLLEEVSFYFTLFT